MCNPDIRRSSDPFPPLLEALLIGGRRFGVIDALNLLACRHPEKLAGKFPVFGEQAGRCEPGSFWLVSC